MTCFTEKESLTESSPSGQGGIQKTSQHARRTSGLSTLLLQILFPYRCPVSISFGINADLVTSILHVFV